MIVPIFKKGNARDCNNYRGINLLNTIVKVYEQIISNKLVPILENSLEESQSGFRSGRNVQDHIFTPVSYTHLDVYKRQYLLFLVHDFCCTPSLFINCIL